MTTTKKTTTARKTVAQRKSAERDAKLEANVEKLRVLNDGDRAAAAIKEGRALRAWEKGGKKGPRPETPNKDAIEAEFKQHGPRSQRPATSTKKSSEPRQLVAPLVDRNVKTIKCVGCGETKPSNVFPTRGKTQRATECRACGIVRRGGTPPAPKKSAPKKSAAKSTSSKKTSTSKSAATKKASTTKKSTARARKAA